MWIATSEWNPGCAFCPTWDSSILFTYILVLMFTLRLEPSTFCLFTYSKTTWYKRIRSSQHTQYPHITTVLIEFNDKCKQWDDVNSY